MQMNDALSMTWTAVCAVEDILPDTGVCALFDGRPVAVFRVSTRDGGLRIGATQAIEETDASIGLADEPVTESGERLFAIGNIDPQSGASVLSRGVVGSLGEHIVVASPLYKQHFDLRTGTCVESPAQQVPRYRVRIADRQVWLAHS